MIRPHLAFAFALIVSLAAVPACGDDDGSVATDDGSVATDGGRADAGPGADAAVADADPSPPTVFGGERPATLIVPPDYDPATPTPLVVALHGYFTSPDYIMPYMRLDSFAADHGTLLIAPDGTVDPDGNAFWNAGGACCDLFGAEPDDVTYLTTMVQDIQAAYNVDPARIFLIGHSNGGFMALRLACDHPELFAAAISHAGAAPAPCEPATPVSVLQVHGDDDPTIRYAGGALRQNDGASVPYPSAAGTVAALAAAAGCDEATETVDPIDLTSAAGAETIVTRHTGCPAGIEAALWTVPSGAHVLSFAATVPDLWWTWLSAHPRPGT